KERLSDLYDRADYSVTIANLFDKDTKEVPSYAENIVYKEIDDMKVAFIGLTAPYETYHLNGYTIENPIDSLQDTLQLIDQEDTDLIILLSHLGLETDRYIANLFSVIQLIIGAHTHHVLLDVD